MTVYKRYLFSWPGSSSFNDFSLAFSEILCVKRNGMGYDETDVTPVGRKVQYEQSTGTFNFDENIFDGLFPPGRFIPEKILVIYKQ
jgi:hypothetical protein